MQHAFLPDEPTYQKLMELAERREELEITRLALSEMKAGEGKPAEQMLAGMRGPPGGAEGSIMTTEFSSVGARHGDGPLFAVIADISLRALDLRDDGGIIGLRIPTKLLAPQIVTEGRLNNRTGHHPVAWHARFADIIEYAGMILRAVWNVTILPDVLKSLQRALLPDEPHFRTLSG